MNGASRRFIVISLMALAVSLLLGVAVAGAIGGVNEADVHQNSKNYQTKTCNDCHDKFGTVSGAAGGWWDAHRRHFVSVFLNFADNQGGVDAYGCAKCHQETTPPTFYEGNASVTKPDAANELNREVRPGVCQECHGGFRTTKHKFDGIEYDYIALRRDCVDCHNPDGPGLDPEVAHGSVPLESSSSIDPFAAGIWWINQRYANTKDFCTRCHGGLAWFQVEETNSGISCSYDLCHKTSASSFLNTSIGEFLEESTVTGSHAIHFDADLGPGITSCDTCHGTDSAAGEHPGHKNSIKNFAGGDSEALSATSVCDSCHSPGGSFNGVDSTTDSVGAKDNWIAGVYDTTKTLAAGNEKWCVGCHDSAPPTIGGQAAPAVAGDNTNYGYFKSGHGLDTGSSYDDDAVGDALGNPGGAIGCDDCHDLSKTHFNGADDTSFDGQRLSGTVNGTATPTTAQVCKGCHQNTLGSLAATRQVSSHGNDTSGGYTDAIEEPFSVECPICHEPHGNNYTGGSRNLKMVRTVFNGNTVAFTSSSGADSYDEDSGDPSDLDDICVTCHITAANNPGYDTTLHAGGNNHQTLGDQRGNDCMGCHKHNSFEDSTVTPSDGFTPGGACDICHTFPPGGAQGTYKGSKSHSMHTTTYAYGCSVCHNEFPVGHNESNVVDKDDWADGVGNDFDPDKVDVVFSEDINPLGESTITTTSNVNNTRFGVGYDSNRTCTNLYCHGQSGLVNGKAFSTLGGLNQAGNIPEWDDGYADGLSSNRHAMTKLTGECGTCHDTTADNQSQGGTFWPTWNTTASVNDWSDSTSPVIWDRTSLTSLGTTVQVAHNSHLDKLRGPKETCNVCHMTPPTVIGTESPGGPSTHVNDELDFIDGATTTVATTACDACHSPGGAHNGVNDTSQSVGAKDSWASGGVYDAGGKLTSATEKWCIGCHDTTGSGSTIKGVTAPAVDGDGSTYGFYATGHGKQLMVKCTDCHDSALEHIDGDYRTYSYASYQSSETVAWYQQGYRLKLVDGDYPMRVPANVSTLLTVDKNAKLCLSCHRQDSVFSDVATPSSNFMRSGEYFDYSGENLGPGTGVTPGNNHDSMMGDPGSPQSLATLWDSDWDTETSDSAFSFGFDSGPLCITCHNVHGSSYGAMLRDGKLSGKTVAESGYDGFEFSWVALDSLEATEVTLAILPTFPVPWTAAYATNTSQRSSSIGGIMRMVGAKSDQRTCSTDSGCHGLDETQIAPSPTYWLNQPGLAVPAVAKTNVLDYYRDPVPVVISALFTSDTTISVVFSETVSAVLGDFNAAGLTENSISGSPGTVIEININSTTDTTGTMSLGAGIFSLANGTTLTPVPDQFIWSGRD